MEDIDQRAEMSLYRASRKNPVTGQDQSKWDLCKECTGTLFLFLDGGMIAVPVPKPLPPPPDSTLTMDHANSP